MINYEGVDYNLDSIIQFQFQALKQLLEALAKKQIEHNIALYGQNKNIKININNNENQDNEENEENDDNESNKENKEKNKKENENKTRDDENKIFYEKIDNSGLIKEFIEYQKQLIEHKKLIEELKSKIEALEKEKEEKSENKNNLTVEEDIKKEKEKEPEKEKEKEEVEIDTDKKSEAKIENNIIIDNNVKKEEIIINKEEKIIEEKKDNKATDIIKSDNKAEKKEENITNINEKIEKEKELENKNNEIEKVETSIVETENKTLINQNYISQEETYIKSKISTFEDNFKLMKEKIEKIQKDTDVNKKSIEISHNELIQFKNLMQRLQDQNFANKDKDKSDLSSYNLDRLEKKMLDLIEQKLRLNKISDNNILKEFKTEKDKLKEENEKMMNDIKTLFDKNAQIENKIKDLPNILEIRKIEEKIKLFSVEIEDCASKNDIKHICNELDKYEKELSKIKSFILNQNDINDKYREDILKLKNSFDNVKKTFSSLNKLFENNSLSQLLANLNDLSKSMVDKEDYNKFIKDINRKITDLQMDVNQNNRNMDEIMPLIQKILTSEDLNKLENSLTGLIEKQNVDAMGKFANKQEIIKSIKSIESQVKVFMKNLDKEREKEKNESVILASKPVGGYKCASCESYIGELKDSYTYIPWNKYHGSERPYRLGSSFSRILQGLNIENTFNPFIHRNLLDNNNKKFQVTNNCLSVKRVKKKIPPLAHVPSEHDMIKTQTIDEPINMDLNYNKRYQNIKNINIWGNKTLRTMGNETNYWNKNKSKDNSYKSHQNKGIAKLFKVSKKVVKTKINNISEDIDSHYVIPNI